ncbi:MAG: hypothetical protein J6Y32_04355 [Bacteroidales bacterium]|nr:hypothetical protein [Bacteroidales bacterium]
MATTQVKILTTALLALVLSACGKEAAAPSVEGSSLIRASLPASMKTKVSMTPSSTGGLALSWQNGDALRVVGESSELYTICPGYRAHVANFTGTPVSGSRFTVFYPGRYISAQQLRERSYAGQTQNGNNSTAHLEWNAMIEDVSDYADLGFSQARQNGVLYWRVELPESAAAPVAITLSAEQAIFPQTNNGTSDMGTSWSLSLSGVSIGADHLLHAWMAIPWTDVALQEGLALNVSVRLADNTQYSRNWSVPTGGLTIRSGQVNVIRLYKSADVDHLDTGLEAYTWTDLFPGDAPVPPTPPTPGEDVTGSQENFGWNDLFPNIPTPPTPPTPSSDVTGSQENYDWNNLVPDVPAPPAPSGNDVTGSLEHFTWTVLQFGV